MARRKTKSKELILQTRPETKKAPEAQPQTVVGKMPSRPVTQDGDWIVTTLEKSLAEKLDRVAQIRLESKKGRARTAATLVLQPKENNPWPLKKRDMLMMAVGAYVIVCLPILIKLLVDIGQ